MASTAPSPDTSAKYFRLSAKCISPLAYNNLANIPYPRSSPPPLDSSYTRIGRGNAHMPLVRNDERRTNHDERNPMTDAAKNLSYLTPTSVMNSKNSTSYL